MAQLVLTFVSGVFAGVAVTAYDPMVAFQSGLVAGVLYLAAWGFAE